MGDKVIEIEEVIDRWSAPNIVILKCVAAK